MRVLCVCVYVWAFLYKYVYIKIYIYLYIYILYWHIYAVYMYTWFSVYKHPQVCPWLETGLQAEWQPRLCDKCQTEQWQGQGHVFEGAWAHTWNVIRVLADASFSRHAPNPALSELQANHCSQHEL